MPAAAPAGLAVGGLLGVDYGDPTGPDLTCPGIGVLADAHIRLAGLFGGGLHQVTADGWSLDMVASD